MGVGRDGRCFATQVGDGIGEGERERLEGVGCESGREGEGVVGLPFTTFEGGHRYAAMHDFEVGGEEGVVGGIGRRQCGDRGVADVEGVVVGCGEPCAPWGRIAFAGCVMPLSKNPNMPKELGTRHHAALGTSEVTDAVVVVVSEETGTISVAVGGMLKRYLAPQTLEKLLQNELNPAEKRESPQSLVERMKQKITAHGKEEGYEKE